MLAKFGELQLSLSYEVWTSGVPDLHLTSIIFSGPRCISVTSSPGQFDGLFTQSSSSVTQFTVVKSSGVTYKGYKADQELINQFTNTVKIHLFEVLVI